MLDDVAHLGGGCRGDGDDDLVDFVVAANRADLLVASQNPQSLDPGSDLGLVIVDKPHIDHPEGRIVMDFPGDHLARGPRPHDQHPSGEFAATATERFSPHTNEVARSENRKDGDPPVEKVDRPRNRYAREKEKIDSHENGRPRGAARRNRENVPDGYKTPPTLEETEDEKSKRLRNQQIEDGFAYHLPVFRRNEKFEADQVGEVIGAHENQQMQEELDHHSITHEEIDRNGQVFFHKLAAVLS